MPGHFPLATLVATMLFVPPLQGQNTVSLPLGEGIKMEFVWVPVPGTDGSISVELGDFTGARVKEPIRSETIVGPFVNGDGEHGFYLGKTEVTEAQWQTIREEGLGSGLPVTGKTHLEILSFIEELNARLQSQIDFPRTPDGSTGVIRLPTEAEWEYAARGGSGISGYRDPDPYRGDLERHEVFSSPDTSGRPGEAGARPPNPLGLHDMLGNVRELVDGNFSLDGRVGGHLLKGGSFISEKSELRSSARAEQARTDAQGRSARSPDVGFRLCISADVFTSLAQAAELTEKLKLQQQTADGPTPVVPALPLSPSQAASADKFTDIINAPKDLEAFTQFIKQLSDGGHPDAQGIYSYLAQTSPHLRTPAEALRLALASSEATSSYGHYALARMMEEGTAVEKNESRAKELYAKAFTGLQKHAEKEEVMALFLVGRMYDFGQFVAKDEVEAVHWYRRAAEQGLAMAQLNLGVMYVNGQGVLKDEAEAVRWFRRAVEQGDAMSQHNLGWMYDNGLGVAKDHAQAVRWYRKAAEQGYATSQYNLGVMYATGQGVAKDEAEAVRWFRKAAEQGDAKSQYNLGVIYAIAQGAAKDEAQAAIWYRKAAEQGLAIAQTNLGIMYGLGQGVGKDKAEAVRWFRKAAEQGEQNAKNALEMLSY